MRTGQLLGEDPPQQSVMDLVLTLHKDMFTGLPGEPLLGAMGVLLLLSLVSGVVGCAIMADAQRSDRAVDHLLAHQP
jgi:uncharacterized iron-regulated membrane protein